MAFILAASDALNDSQKVDLTRMKPLRPFIFGPAARLHRYAAAAEKSGIKIGAYDASVAQTYAWPGKESGSTIDTTYTKVWLEDALLNYFNDYIGTGGTVAPVAGYKNRVRDDSYVFKTANGVSRSSTFLDRDVTVGDTITLTSGATTLSTTVKSLIADNSSAATAAASSDANNKADQAASASVTQVAGTPVNCVAAVASASAYDSLDDGYITRTYKITVTTGSTGGDATTARLSVVDSSGNLDNQSSVTPAAFGAATSIGTKGLTVTFSNTVGASCSSAANASGLLVADLVVGQQWTVTVNQDFTAPTATSGGTYTGTSDTTYIVTVTTGGDASTATKPQVTVTSTTGLDSSGPTNVTAAATDVAVGNYGITVQFDQAQLRKGDIYYIAVTAAAPAAVRTIELNDDLPTALQSASDLDLRLFIKQSVVAVAENRLVPSPGVNWSQTQSSVTVQPNFRTYDSTWTDGGVEIDLPVTSATLYIEYREWSYTLVTTGQVHDIASLNDVATALGTVDPDNPLAYAVEKALENTATAVLTAPSAQAAANTDVIRYAALAGDPALSASWTDALDMVAGLDDIYTLVPLTTDATIQGLVATHVASQSAASSSFYRCCLLAASVDDSVVIVDSTKTSDSTTALATIAQDPALSSTSYTYLRVAAGNADFQTNGVQAGDTVRYLYSLDAYGDETYSEYTVSSVVSEDALLLESGPSQTYSTAQRVEVWRDRSKSELVTALTGVAAGYASDRVCYVWPDTLEVGASSVAGYYLCAALAGQMGSLASHQGLRNVEVLGFDGATRSRNFFNRSQLDALVAGGVWVVNQASDGTLYTYWPTTTDPSTVNTREEMVRRNKDMFAFAILGQWDQYLGSANISAELLILLRAKFTSLVSSFQTSGYTDRLGVPVIDATLDTLVRSDTLKDHLIAAVTLVGPSPQNKTELTVSLS